MPIRIEQIKKQVKKTGMLSGQDRVICGLSGGADSVFLFLLLCALRRDLGFELRACHVHHGIRGAEADEDAAFTESLCEREEVPFRLFVRDVPKEAARNGESLEEAGRRVRHACFREMAEEWGREMKPRPDGQPALIKTALAHHENDLAESVLFRLARGSGIHGLAAMRPVSPMGPGLLLIRPLLGVSREEIEEALLAAGEKWREDSTNAENDAVRNRIRHEILPILSSRVNEGAVRHIAGLAGRAVSVSDFLREEARRRAGAYLREEAGTLHVAESLLAEEMPAMQEEILRYALFKMSEGLKDVGSVHVDALLALFSRESGKELHLPRRVAAERDSGGVLLRISPEKKEEVREKPVVPLRPGESVFYGNMRISASLGPSVPGTPEEKRYTKMLDYDKIQDTLVLRCRQRGDFLTVRKDGARKSLSDYFTDSRLPRGERDEMILVADGSEIAWVIGMRIGYRYRITEETTRVLTVTAEEI